MSKSVSEQYSDEEAATRRDALAKQMLKMSPKPLKAKTDDKAKRPKKPSKTS